MTTSHVQYPAWVRGDLDGFFGLMVDNLVQVLLIIVLCSMYAGLEPDFITSTVLPGVAISLLIGNLFYGIQAHVVARRTSNMSCTALPYGINTPSVFAFVLFIMKPVYEQAIGEGVKTTDAARLAWQAGLMACLVSGAIEFGSAFFAERLRRVTPRAALLGVLAAVGLTFIAADFAFRIFTSPLVAIVPMAILLLAYFAKYKFPWHLPGGLVAVIVGTALAWMLSYTNLLGAVGGQAHRSAEELMDAWSEVDWIAPTFFGAEIWALLKQPDLMMRFLTVSVPMGIINALGSLQNIESAEAAGDKFKTGPSLAVNGLGTIAAACFGSCFPTTIYIGHPAWKALGARAGYSILNGLFFTICFLFGFGDVLKELIPIEAGAAIVVYIGIIITAQAFQATPREHAPAVAIALFPAIAAILVVYLQQFLIDARAPVTLAQMLRSLDPNSLVQTLPGMIALFGANSGWLITALVLTAMAVALIDKKYVAAAVWSGVATVLTTLGLLHSYRVIRNEIHEFFLWQSAPEAGSGVYSSRGYGFAIAYGASTLMLIAVAIHQRRREAQLTASIPPDIAA